jgi:spermidine synthase
MRSRDSGPLALYCAALLLSAFLLFWIQPLFARLLLPRFGGAAAVWNTCLLFYQAVLLLGYGYAHLSSRWLRPSRQTLLHLLVLLLPLPFLPIAMAAGWMPPGDANPIPWLLGALAASVAGPVLVLGTSAPLLQRWYSYLGLRLSRDPYPLYAASNLGSMLALLAYPFLLEPTLGLREQGVLWSALYLLLVLLVLACALSVRRASAHAPPEEPAPAAVPLWPAKLQWLMLSFVPASLMYGVTTMLTTDVAAVPLLWVLPLTLYLLTFILAFLKRAFVPHRLLAPAVPVLLMAMLMTFLLNHVHSVRLYAVSHLIALHLAGFFVSAYVLHRELAERRPAPAHLTGFYLWISFGGVLAGVFNAIAAPLFFDLVLEYPLALVLAGLLLLPVAAASRPSRIFVVLVLAGSVAALSYLLAENLRWQGLAGNLPVYLLFALMLAAIRLGFQVARTAVAFTMAAAVLLGQFAPGTEGLMHLERSFFSVHRVLYHARQGMNAYQHGTTIHGRQSVSSLRRREPLAYFHPTGPIGQAIGALEAEGRLQRVAVIGLGIGTLAAYAQPGQRWDFYEIDPVVEQIARDERFFTYLKDARGECHVILGDGRLQLAAMEGARYDLIVLDAFSSDSVPVHLLTREAFQLYLRRLTPGGVLAANITNRYVNLAPVLSAVASEMRLSGLLQHETPDITEAPVPGKSLSSWVVLARQAGETASVAAGGRWQPLESVPPVRIWTDDYSDILSVLQYRF